MSSELGDRDLLVGAARGVGLVERLLRAEDGHLERLAAEPVGERSAGRRAGFDTVIQMTRARLQRAISHMDEDALPSPTEDRGFRAERLIE